MQTINLKITIFQCSKNCGSMTCVTRLKVAPNMADPISLEDSDRRLKLLVFLKKTYAEPIPTQHVPFILVDYKICYFL